MIICPVCEHQQALGTECDVCGKQLAAPRQAQVPVDRMPDLELTPLVRPGIPVQQMPMPDLDRGRAPSVPELPGAPMPELDMGRASQVSVPVERIADLERHREDAGGDPATPAPIGAVTCRYCRNVQAEGAICDRCGMRLPRYVAAAAPVELGSPEDAPTVRHACGVKTRAGAPCESCGVFVPLSFE